jgi:hypothetical protein
MPYKHESKKEFLDFFDASPEDSRRSRGGVYSSTLFTDDHGDEIKSGGGVNGAGGVVNHHRSVLVVSLDLRWFKDSSGLEGDFLGEEQWTWLEATLKDSSASAHVRSFLGNYCCFSGVKLVPFAEYLCVTCTRVCCASDVPQQIFVSSVQFLVEGRELVSECWSDFPNARGRFLQLVSLTFYIHKSK